MKTGGRIGKRANLSRVTQPVLPHMSDGSTRQQGIGRRLTRQFERPCVAHGPEKIKVQATLYAVPFYLVLGYKKATGIR